jgi:hypothetical protein
MKIYFFIEDNMWYELSCKDCKELFLGLIIFIAGLIILTLISAGTSSSHENFVRRKCCDSNDKCTVYDSCYDYLENIVKKCGLSFEKILKDGCQQIPVHRSRTFVTICDWNALIKNCKSLKTI